MFLISAVLGLNISVVSVTTRNCWLFDSNNNPADVDKPSYKVDGNVLEASRSIGSASETVCAVNAHILKYSLGRDMITFSPLKNTNLFLKNIVLLILLPTKLGLGLVTLSPTSLFAQSIGATSNVRSDKRLIWCGIVV